MKHTTHSRDGCRIEIESRREVNGDDAYRVKIEWSLYVKDPEQMRVGHPAPIPVRMSHLVADKATEELIFAFQDHIATDK